MPISKYYFFPFFQIVPKRTVTAWHTNQDLSLLTLQVNNGTASALVALWDDKADMFNALLGTSVTTQKAIRDTWDNMLINNTKSFTTTTVCNPYDI